MSGFHEKWTFANVQNAKQLIGKRKMRHIRTLSKTCKVFGCHKKHNCMGYCVNHYYHFKRYGDPKKYADLSVIMKGINTAEKNGQWRGEKVGKVSLHEWVRNRIPYNGICWSCGETKKYTLDLANKSGLYKRDLSDWEYLCRTCHMKSDGRFNIIHVRKLPDIKCEMCKVEFRPSSSIRRFCSRSCSSKRVTSHV